MACCCPAPATLQRKRRPRRDEGRERGRGVHPSCPSRPLLLPLCLWVGIVRMPWDGSIAMQQCLLLDLDTPKFQISTR